MLDKMAAAIDAAIDAAMKTPSTAEHWKGMGIAPMGGTRVLVAW